MSLNPLRLFSGSAAPFARLGSAASGLVVLAACQGLTAYNPGADTDPGDDPDPDSDSDPDSDTDPDTDPQTVDLDLSEIAPDWGSNAGGTEISIRGGPFDSSARVWFGAKEATVTSSTKNRLVVTLPKSTETGAVDVKVTTDTGEGIGTSGFYYWADGTGQYAAFGQLGWYHMVGTYWSSTPADFGYASVFFTDAVDTPPWRLSYSGSKDSCKSDYTYSGDVGVYEFDADSIKLELPTGATMSLPKDPDATYAFGTELAASQFKQNGTYGLEEIVASDFPPITNPELIVTPTSFSVSQPAIAGSTPPTLSKAISFQWQTSGAGDYVLILLNRYNASFVMQETVTCVANDDGAFNVPSSVWAGWSSGGQLDVLVGRAREASGTFEHNNATSGVLGVYWVYGAGFQQ